MRRILISGIALLLCGVITAHSKPDPLVFVFLRVDPTHDVAILRPMIAPDIGVQLDSGPRTLQSGTVLQCAASKREHAAIVEGQVGKVSELVLDCGDHKFVVKPWSFRHTRPLGSTATLSCAPAPAPASANLQPHRNQHI